MASFHKFLSIIHGQQINVLCLGVSAVMVTSSSTRCVSSAAYRIAKVLHGVW